MTKKEAIRIMKELENLRGFSEDGIVRTVLRERVEQEFLRKKGKRKGDLKSK